MIGGSEFFKECLEKKELEIFSELHSLFCDNVIEAIISSDISTQEKVEFLITSLKKNLINPTPSQARILLEFGKSNFPEFLNEIKLTLIRSSKNKQVLKQSQSDTELGIKYRKPAIKRKKSLPIDSPRRRKQSLANFLFAKHALMFQDLDIESLILKKDKQNCMIRWFNRIAYWVGFTILERKSKTQRQTEIRKWIKTAKKLRNLFDFQGVMEIVAGLSSVSIQRLPCWKTLSSQWMNKFVEIEKDVSYERNYERYRSILKENVDNKLIPYIGIYKRDLTLVLEANSLFIGKSKEINWETLYLLHKIISDIKQRQSLLGPQTSTNDKIFSGEFEIPLEISNESLYKMSLTICPMLLSPECVFPSSSSSESLCSQNEEQIMDLWKIPVVKWTPENVGGWLYWIGFPEYSSRFIEEEICGEDLFELSNDDLVYLGVNKVGPAIKLKKLIHRMFVTGEVCK